MSNSIPKPGSIMMWGEPHLDYLGSKIENFVMGKDFGRIFLSNKSTIWVGINHETMEFEILYEPADKQEFDKGK